MGADRRAPAVVGVIALLLAAFSAATSGGLHWSTPHLSGHATVTSQAPGGGSANQTQNDVQNSSPGTPTQQDWSGSIATFGLVVIVVVGVLVAVALLRLRVRRRQLSGHGRGRPAFNAPSEPESSAVDEPEALMDKPLQALDVGSPRNAIVAAWVQLEEFAIARGLSRDPAETPAEFVARALAAYDLDGVALARFADLYREARFSTHPVSEEHRVEARQHLEHLTRAVSR